MTDDREPLGRLVRETWVAWARSSRPKPSWLFMWEQLPGTIPSARLTCASGRPWQSGP